MINFCHGIRAYNCNCLNYVCILCILYEILPYYEIVKIMLLMLNVKSLDHNTVIRSLVGKGDFSHAIVTAL